MVNFRLKIYPKPSDWRHKTCSESWTGRPADISFVLEIKPLPDFLHFQIIDLMFGQTKKPNPATSSSTDVSGDQTCVIAKGTTIEGKFFCSENVRLEGAINGQIKVDKRLVMGETGLVDGNILATNCAVRGKIHGDIVVKEQLHLLETAFVDGNIQATSMVVDEGARHNGRSSIGSAK